MKKKKRKKFGIYILLGFMICVLIFSTAGLKLLTSVSAESNNQTTELELDAVEENELLNLTYNSGENANANKTPVKIENVEQSINLINTFFKNNAYEVTSNGKMNITASSIKGLVSASNLNICDVNYFDTFSRDSSGYVCWKEAFKLASLNSSAVQTIYNLIKGLFGNVAQFNEYYFVDDETFYNIYISKDEVEFEDGFNVKPSVWNNATVEKKSNAQQLKTTGYMQRAFRWDINDKTVMNPTLTKKINGYQFEFDLNEGGIRDVFHRITSVLPTNLTNYYNAKQFHYVYNFDAYGNIISFTREEVIAMGFTGFGFTIDCDLKFLFKYDVKLKDENYKLGISDKMAEAISAIK